MIQEWPDLALGLGMPSVAICQTRSASTDLGPVLPSFPHFPSMSQAIFISSACHPPSEGASLPARPGRSQPILQLGGYDNCKQNARQDNPFACHEQVRLGDLCVPIATPIPPGPEAWLPLCQLLMNPLAVLSYSASLGLAAGRVWYSEETWYKEYSALPPPPPCRPFLESASILCQCCDQVDTTAPGIT